MKKNKKLIFTLIFILLFTLTTITVYAAFSFSNDYAANVETDTVNDITFNDTNSSEKLNYSFKSAGDSVIYEYSVKNTTNKLVNYNFYLSTNKENESEIKSLQSSILVYYANNPGNIEEQALDYSFAGTLSNLADERFKTYLLDNNRFLAKGDTKNFKLKLVLHNSSSINKTYKSSIKLNCEIENCDATKYSMVETESDLKNVLYANNTYNLNKTIVLANNIELTETIEISKSLTINLNGHTLSGANININNTLNINDEYNGTLSNALILNNEEAFVWFDNGITIPASITLTNYSSAKLKAKIDNVMTDFLLKDSSYPILGNNVFYDSTEIVGDGYTYSSGVITKTATNNKVSTITIKDTEYEFKIVSYTNHQSDIINNGLSHLVAYDNTNNNGQKKELSFDIYLPTTLPEYNANIIWNSTDESIISNTGKADESGDVTLYATIEYDGNAFTTSFKLSVVKQNNQTRFEYLLSKIGSINFTSVWDGATYDENQGGIKFLFDENNYLEIEDMEDIGLRSLSYSVDSMYYYLSVSSYDTRPVAYLNSPTFDKFALLNVHATFIEDPDNTEDTFKEYTGTLNVTINLKDNDELLRQVMNYVTSYIDNQDVLQNMLDTRVEHGIPNEKGDFVLPVEYMGYTINYVYRDPGENLSGVYSIADYALLYNGRVYYTNDANKITIDGSDYNIVNGYVTINTSFEIKDNQVIIDSLSYEKKRYVKVADVNDTYLYYEVIEPNGGEPAKVIIGGNIRDITNDDVIVEGFLIDGVFYAFTKNGDNIIIPIQYKLQKAVVINPTKFDITEREISIDVELSYEGRPVASTTSSIDVDADSSGVKHNNYTPPAFTIPAAIHSDSNNTFNQVWFPLIKYQVLQQSDYTVLFIDNKIMHVTYDNNTYIYNPKDNKLYSINGVVNNDVTVITRNGVLGIDRGGWKPIITGGYPVVTREMVAAQGDYMLMYDILCADTIVIEGYNNQYSQPIALTDLSEFMIAIEWATGESTSTCTLFAGKDYSWFPADGRDTISDYESYALIDYFQEMPWFDQLLKYYLYGANIKENTITEEAENTLRGMVSDSYFFKLVQWATSTSSETARAYAFNGMTDSEIMTSLEVTQDYYKFLSVAINNIDNGDSGISNLEEQVILRYIMCKYPLKFDSFYSTWTSSITRIDDVITQEIKGTVQELSYILGSGLALDVFDTIKAWAQHYPTTNNSSTTEAAAYWYAHHNGIRTSSGKGSSYTGTTLYDYFKTNYGEDIGNKLISIFGLSEVKDKANGYASAGVKIDLGFVRESYKSCDMTTIAERDVLLAFISNLGIADDYGFPLANYEEVYNTEKNSTSNTVFTSYGKSICSTSALGSTQDITVSCFNDNLWNYYRNAVSAATTLTQEQSNNLSNLVSWATGNTKQSVLSGDYSNSNYLLSDGLNTISYDEFVEIKNFVNTLNKPKSFEDNILSLFLSTNNNDYAFLNSDLSSTANLVSSLGLTNAIEFEDFIKKAKELNSSYLSDAIFDGVPTLSYEEYIALLAIVDSSEDIKTDWDNAVNSYFKYIATADKSSANYKSLNTKDAFIERIRDIKPDLYYIASNDNLNGRYFMGLKYFINLENFYGRNLTGEANVIFNTVTSYTNCTTIELTDSGLTDISSLDKVNYLKYLDISGNSNLSDISILNSIDTSKLGFLDIRGTNVDITYNITTLDNIFTNYVSGSIENVIYSDIRYYDNILGLDKVYRNDSQTIAMKYAFLLKEMSVLNGSQILLPTQIVVDSNNVISGNNIIWKIESGEALTIKYNGKLKYLEVNKDAFGDNSSLDCVVSVTVKYNNATYTRYFTITVYK